LALGDGLRCLDMAVALLVGAFVRLVGALRRVHAHVRAGVPSSLCFRRHPSTVMTAADVACVMRLQGRLEEGTSLTRQALEVYG
jgi:hypothetical protein